VVPLPHAVKVWLETSVNAKAEEGYIQAPCGATLKATGLPLREKSWLAAGAGAAAAITWLVVVQTIARAAMSKLNLIFVSAFEAVFLNEFH